MQRRGPSGHRERRRRVRRRWERRRVRGPNVAAWLHMVAGMLASPEPG